MSHLGEKRKGGDGGTRVRLGKYILSSIFHT